MKDAIIKSIESCIEQLKLNGVSPKNRKYIYISHIYRDVLEESNQLEEITKLEKMLGVEIVFT